MKLTEKQNQILERAQFMMNADIFFFAEELTDYKIVPFKQSITEIVPQKKNRSKLMAAVIIADFPMDDRKAKFTVLKYRESTREFFIKLGNLNEAWDKISECLAYEIKQRRTRKQKCRIHEPNDIIDVRYLCDSTFEAVFSESKVILREKEVDRQKLLLKSKRQSKMDMKDLLFVFSKEEKIAHDKECDQVPSIPDEMFDASHDLPEEYAICPKCARLSAIRRGCFPNTKEIPFCRKFFDELHAGTSCLIKIVDKGVTFHTDNLDEMTLKGAEDTWIIKNDSGTPVLFHNNYVKLSDTERCITEGFHNQKWLGMSINSMLYMISKYTWKRHLDGVEAARKIDEIAMTLSVSEEEKITTAEPEICEPGVIKRIWNSLVNGFRKLFKKDSAVYGV